MVPIVHVLNRERYTATWPQGELRNGLCLRERQCYPEQPIVPVRWEVRMVPPAPPDVLELLLGPGCRSR